VAKVSALFGKSLCYEHRSKGPPLRGSAEKRSSFLFYHFLIFGWTGWTGWIGTATSGTSRVHPGILTLDTVDRGSRHPSASGDGPRSDCVTYNELSLTGPMALTNPSPTSAISLRARSFASVRVQPVERIGSLVLLRSCEISRWSAAR
jgi:hypothetical protein